MNIPVEHEPDNFVAIVAFEQKKIKHNAELLSRLEPEYKKVLQQVLSLLKKENRHVQARQNYLDVLYERCFAGTALTALMSKYKKKSPSDIYQMKTQGKNIILKYIDQGLIQISDELISFLARPHPKASKLPLECTAEELRVLTRERIVKTLGLFQGSGLAYSDADVDVLMEKISGANVELAGCTRNNLLNYAYICAKNATVDKLRRTEAKPRIEARASVKAAKERQQALQAEIDRKNFEAAKQEYISLMGYLAVQHNDNSSAQKQLGILYFTKFELETDAELNKRFQGTKRNTRDQWRTRARKMIIPLASDNLKNFLKRRISGPKI